VYATPKQIEKLKTQGVHMRTETQKAKENKRNQQQGYNRYTKSNIKPKSPLPYYQFQTPIFTH
jgi:hypothetical protein